MEELLSYLPSLFQAGKGIADWFQGNAFGNAQRPTETVPASVQQATAVARQQAASPILPGAGLLQNQISGNTAAGVNTAIQGGNPQGSIGALVNNQNNQFENLAIKGVQRQDQNKTAYAQQLNTQGEYEQKAWDWNYAKPYEYAQTASNTYREGGLGEIFNSLKGGGQTYMLLDMLKKLQGNNPSTTNDPNYASLTALHPPSYFDNPAGGGTPTLPQQSFLPTTDYTKDAYWQAMLPQ